MAISVQGVWWIEHLVVILIVVAAALIQVVIAASLLREINLLSARINGRDYLINYARVINGVV